METWLELRFLLLGTAGVLTIACWAIVPRRVRAAGAILAGSLALVVGLNVAAFERTFRSYVYDGTPIVGWPVVALSGTPGWVPPPARPPDIVLLREPYWLGPTAWRYDLGIGALVSIGSVICFLRSPGVSRFFVRRSEGDVRNWLRELVEFVARLIGFAVTIRWMMSHNLWYEYPVWTDFILRDRAILGLLSGLLCWPVFFPRHVWRRLVATDGSLTARRPWWMIATSAAATILLFPALGFAIERVFAGVAQASDHYVNLQLTAFCVALQIGTCLSWIGMEFFRSRIRPVAAQQFRRDAGN